MAHVRLLRTNRAAFVLAGLTLLVACPRAHAQQFVLFDATFTFTKEDADNSKPSKSHYYVRDKMLNPDRPKDWTQPVDYRNGTVHVRLEVIEKPAGGAATTWTLCYILLLARHHYYQAAKLSRRSTADCNSRSVAPTRRAARISSPSSSRRHARRLSAWLGRRDSSSHGDADRWLTSPFASRFQAHASVIVKVHRQTWKAPTLARTSRTCCWPAPTTCFRSRKQVSRLKRPATLPRMSATVAAVSVQKNATHPFGSSTSTTRMAPPAGRHVATNVLYFFSVAFPYRVNVPVAHPRRWPA